jgi:flagellar basal-body rod protein FlgB
MMNNKLYDTTMQTLGKVLDLRSQKLQLIASNIANAETPGYAAKRFDFEQDLREAVFGTTAGRSVTHPKHIPIASGQEIESLQGTVYEEPGTGRIGDGNSVSVDQEMVALSQNQLKYEAAVKALSKKISMLKLVIQEKV